MVRSNYDRKQLHPSEKDEIVRMAQDGASAQEIACALSRPESTIRTYLSRNGIKVRRNNKIYTERMMQQVHQILESGATMRIAAEAIGVNLNYLRQAYNAYHIGLLQKKSLIHFDKTDPRSAVCQTIEYCSHKTCHMHEKCPSYLAYQEKNNANTK